MKYRVLVGLLVLVGMGAEISCGGGSSSGSVAIQNPGVIGTSFIFVATQGDNLLSPFIIDRSTGKTTTHGAGVATGTRPIAGIMTPDGNSIFVANHDSGDVSRYTIKADGTLTAVTPPVSIGATANPVAMAMDAAGKLLFVLNEGPVGGTKASTISSFTIAASAALTAGPVTTGLDNATALAVTPDGKYLYATNSVTNMISGYSVGADGTLTQLVGFPIISGTIPTGMIVTPDDPANPSPNQISLYVANANGGAGNISVYTICDKVTINCVTPDGTLTEITGSPFVASGEPGPMVIVNPAVTTPPSGTYLYAVDHKLNRILQYSVSFVTGTLTPMSTPSLSTGSTPVWVGARENGQYVFTANNGGTSVSSFIITDPTSGALTNNGGTAVFATGNSPSVVLVK